MTTHARLASALRVIGLGEMAQAVDALASDAPEALAVAIKDGIDRLPLMQACAAASVRRPDDLIELMRHGARDTRTAAAPQPEPAVAAPTVSAVPAVLAASVPPAPAGPSAPSGSLWARLTPDQQALATKMGKLTLEAQEDFAGAYLGIVTPAAAAPPTAPAPVQAQPPAGGYWSLLSEVQRTFAARLGVKTPESRENFAREYLESAGLLR